jgi:hypothetical protein
MAAKEKTRGRTVHEEPLPFYCDFSCRHAAFAPPDASGACRREQAVYCSLMKQFNNKNAPCIARRKQTA